MYIRKNVLFRIIPYLIVKITTTWLKVKQQKNIVDTTLGMQYNSAMCLLQTEFKFLQNSGICFMAIKNKQLSTP